jgi:hypothetical protein
VTSPAIRSEWDGLDEAIARLNALSLDDFSDGPCAFGWMDWSPRDAIRRASAAVERIACLAHLELRVKTPAGLTVVPLSGNVRTALYGERTRDSEASHCQAVNRALARRSKFVILAAAAVRAFRNIVTAANNPLKLPAAVRAATDLVTAIEGVIDLPPDAAAD